jgi:transcriptional regulator with XRE-family HTH domain
MLQKIISNNLRQLRKERAWSLSHTAIETGVSKAMLGQIEREESNPTIVTLWRIAKGFKISMSSLIERPLVTSKNVQQVVKTALVFDNIEFKVLFSYDPLLGSEMFEHILQPNKTHLSQAHEIGVQEDIIVIQGQMDMLVDGRWHPLEKGSVLRFAADQPHGYRNLSDHKTIFHNIIHYPRQAL